jgi:hypothetical protein
VCSPLFCALLAWAMIELGGTYGFEYVENTHHCPVCRSHLGHDRTRRRDVDDGADGGGLGERDDVRV